MTPAATTDYSSRTLLYHRSGGCPRDFLERYPETNCVPTVLLSQSLYCRRRGRRFKDCPDYLLNALIEWIYHTTGVPLEPDHFQDPLFRVALFRAPKATTSPSKPARPVSIMNFTVEDLRFKILNIHDLLFVLCGCQVRAAVDSAHNCL